MHNPSTYRTRGNVFFVYMGTGGQNDRGPLEALACGTKIIIANPRRHSPIVYENKKICSVINHNDFLGTAKTIHESLESYCKENVSNYFIEKSGMDKVILPKMIELFDVMKFHKTNPSAKYLKEHYKL